MSPISSIKYIASVQSTAKKKFYHVDIQDKNGKYLFNKYQQKAV